MRNIFAAVARTGISGNLKIIHLVCVDGTQKEIKMYVLTNFGKQRPYINPSGSLNEVDQSGGGDGKVMGTRRHEKLMHVLLRSFNFVKLILI